MKTIGVRSMSDVTGCSGLEQPICEQTFPLFFFSENGLHHRAGNGMELLNFTVEFGLCFIWY